jgi:hypothetical protein
MTRANVVELSAEQRNALKALAAAARYAAQLAPLFTPAGFLGPDDTGQHDKILSAIDVLAKTYFDGDEDLDFEQAIAARFVGVEPTDDRVRELFDLHVDAVHAQRLAAFALGVSWERRAR